MGSLSTTEMPRLDRVIHPPGENINSKGHGCEHRKHVEKNIVCDGGGFIFTLSHFNHRILLYFLPACLGGGFGVCK